MKLTKLEFWIGSTCWTLAVLAIGMFIGMASIMPK